MQDKECKTPVRYCDDVYYIGTRYSPAWVLINRDGSLTMIDTAMPADLDHILSGLDQLGLRAHDIAHIVHSHGHIDHIGCTRALVEMSGATTYIGRGDEGSVRGENGLQYTNEFGMRYEGAFSPDVILEDGECREIGGRPFTFLITPGHTQGALTFFFPAHDGGREVRAGMFGGGGLKTMEYAYLDRYGLPHSLRDDFLAAIDRVMGERVELHLGNHLGDNAHYNKLSRVGTSPENPFVDTATWSAFLTARRAEAVAHFKEH